MCRSTGFRPAGAILAASLACAAPAAASPAQGGPDVTIVRVETLASVARVDTRIRPWSRRFVLRLYLDGVYAGFSRSSKGGVLHGVASGLHSLQAVVFAHGRRLAGSRPFRFRARESAGRLVAAAGDIACDPADAAFDAGSGSRDRCAQAATAAIVARVGPDAVLPLGDLQYECGSLPAFGASYGPTWGRFLPISHPVPGNHEYATDGTVDERHTPCAGASAYFAYFGTAAGDPSAGYYSYDLGTWHLVALNSECSSIAGGCGTGSPEERWLRADLAASAARCTLAYWHRPRWSVRRGRGRPSLAALWRALYEGGADVVLNGHEHLYARFAPIGALGNPDPTGMRQFIVGTGGKSLTWPFPRRRNVERVGSTFGALLLSLEPGRYAWGFAPVAGRSFTDLGAASCR